MDQGEFMRAQVNYFIENGIDPDAMTREELANASITFRQKYETETETSKDTDSSESHPS